MHSVVLIGFGVQAYGERGVSGLRVVTGLVAFVESGKYNIMVYA